MPLISPPPSNHPFCNNSNIIKIKNFDFYIVHCPVGHDEEETRANFGLFGLTTQMPNSECVGALFITHSNIDSLSNYKRARLYDKKEYPNLRRGFNIFKQNIIIHLESEGNCCWELYSRKRFRGTDKQDIIPGISFYPDFQPRSIRKKNC